MSSAESPSPSRLHPPIELPPALPFFDPGEDTPSYQAESLNSMRAFYEYTITRSDITSSFGFPILTRKLEGVQPGLYLVAGAPNLGKTAFMTHLAWQIAHHNDNYVCIFLTLDDNARTVYPRFCSIASRIPMNVFLMPRRLAGNPEFRSRYFEGLEAIARASDKIIVLDQEVGTDVEVVEKTLLRWKTAIEQAGLEKSLALFIDNFHDLTTSERHRMKEKNDRYEYVATQLKRISEQNNMPIFATTEVRKVGLKRPTLDDIRETGNIAYEANVVFGIFNEVGLKGEAAQIYYRTHEDGPKQPVLEVDFLKNKLSSYKGRLFYHFVPEMSYLQEADQETQDYYESRLRS